MKRTRAATTSPRGRGKAPPRAKSPTPTLRRPKQQPKQALQLNWSGGRGGNEGDDEELSSGSDDDDDDDDDLGALAEGRAPRGKKRGAGGGEDDEEADRAEAEANETADQKRLRLARCVNLCI